MAKGQTLQDPFLNTLRKEKVPVSIYLVNGIKLQGQIESFDQYVVLLRNTVTQMVYKLNGFSLLRDASQQATQGVALSFIEESEPGDLAFFDNAEGSIIHVGIIMENNYIIHAHGKVRIDRLDHSGIYNVDKNN